MNTEETIEGNKIIAEFMEFESDKTLIYKVPNLFPNKGYESGFTEFSVTRIGFNTDWNMLMPVVEKIAKTMFNDNEPDDVTDTAYPRTFAMPDGEGNFMVRFNRCSLLYSKSLIVAVWLAVVDFIKWYNQNKV